MIFFFTLIISDKVVLNELMLSVQESACVAFLISNFKSDSLKYFSKFWVGSGKKRTWNVPGWK